MSVKVLIVGANPMFEKKNDEITLPVKVTLPLLVDNVFVLYVNRYLIYSLYTLGFTFSLTFYIYEYLSMYL